MKFGKLLQDASNLSDDEWAPFWINYELLKSKIQLIVELNKAMMGGMIVRQQLNSRITAHEPASSISTSAMECDFFKSIFVEVKKTNDFFMSTQEVFRIRFERITEGYAMFQKFYLKSESSSISPEHKRQAWLRLLHACFNFYKDVLSLENYAVMNYCGFSKILKKHDKLTGFRTRDAFMLNVMSKQSITHYPFVVRLIGQTERLFAEIQAIDRYHWYLCRNS